MKHHNPMLRLRTHKRLHPLFPANPAFTLLEILIVLVIISILIGTAIPNIQRTRVEGKRQQAKAEINSLVTAIESYYIHNSNSLPANLSALTSAAPRIVSSIPNDPFNVGFTYQYAKDANDIYYVVWSFGPDESSDITGISSDGNLQGVEDDDLFASNGTEAF